MEEQQILVLSFPEILVQPPDPEAVREHRTRKRLEAAHAQIVYTTYQSKGTQDALSLGGIMGYKKSTIYSAIQHRGKLTLKYLHPEHKQKWSSTQIERAKDTIEKDPTLTLSEIIGIHREEGFPKIDPSTLHRYFDRELITYKAGGSHEISYNSTSECTLRSFL
jgi:hypothetical protein